MTRLFDENLSEHGLSRAKWEMEIARTGDPGVLCFGTADMDFRSPPRWSTLLPRSWPGGTSDTPTSRTAITPQSWTTTHAGPDGNLQRGWLRSGVGIYASMHTLIDELTEPDDEIVFQTPVHHIFREIVEANGRIPVENPLVAVDGRYQMDLDASASQMGPRTRMLLLCNPHNPVGRAWTHNELESLNEFCAERGIVVVADEVYYALLHDGTTFTPFASLSSAASKNTVTVTSASKSFNLTGFKHSLVIAENADLLEAYDRGQRKANAYFGGSTMGIVATEAALRRGDGWVVELMSHIAANRAVLRHWFGTNAPEVTVFDADSTYFAWLDCRAWGLRDDQLMRWLEEDARIILTAGHALGTGGSGHVRWNLACSRATLEKGLARLGEALLRRKTPGS